MDSLEENGPSPKKNRVRKKRRGQFINFSKCEEIEQNISNLLKIANSVGEKGREITIEDLVLFSISRLTERDISEIRASTLSDEQKFKIGLEATYAKHLESGGEEMSLWAFALKMNNKLEKSALKVIQ